MSFFEEFFEGFFGVGGADVDGFDDFATLFVTDLDADGV